MLAEAQSEMLAYGDPLYDGKSSQGALLLQIITRFSSNYRDAIDGKLTDLSINELYGGARINYIFNEVFSKCLNDINPTDGLTANDIRTAIRNATGPKAALFVPEVSFELLVKGQVSRLEEPSIQCVELVYDELQRIVSQLETQELLRFANLRSQVVETVNSLLNRYKTPTKEMIMNLIRIELAFINTNHPDFVGGDGAITTILEKIAKQDQPQPQPAAVPVTEPNRRGSVAPAVPAKTTAPAVSSASSPSNDQGFFNLFFGKQQGSLTAPTASQSSFQGSSMGKKGLTSEKLSQVPATIKPINKPTDKENFETELIKHLLVSYFDIVRKNVKDSVPKSIMHFLVNCSKEHIQNELVACLYKEELFESLLEESSVIAQRRAQCKAMMDVLRKAHEILNEVRAVSYTHLTLPTT
eukprot:TRINITY_DN4972_c0_g1_i1.p1 TRINITY_DN4972_c0_g1~~TRINITY_DN4972_c0_g1_i1.p1  ORF type:complete len:479 (+),score=118.06 TRINITY_DN4972_c0_g1_i1:201-1439(+)